MHSSDPYGRNIKVGVPLWLQDVTRPQGPKNAIKITHLGINIKVITCFTNGFY